MPKVKVNNISLYYEIHGEGEPLVFIGGLANDLTDYTERTKIIDMLAQHFKVIMIDNRGSGRSDKPDIPYSIEMMADDTAALMKALEVSKVYVLGISMGGRIALDLAIRYPTLVDKLVLVSTAAHVTQNLKRFLLLGFFAKVPLSRSKYPQPKYAFVRQKKASSEYNAVDKLDQIKIPTLIMHGKKDGIVPYKLALALHHGIKGSHLNTFDGGHMFMLPKQKEFSDAVTDFLNAK